MSDCLILQYSKQLTIRLHMYINTLNLFLLHLQLKLMHILTKSLPPIHPNLTLLWKMCVFHNFCQLCWQFLPILLALCSMLLLSYYAQNYVGIIGLLQVIRQYKFYIYFIGNVWWFFVTHISLVYRPIEALFVLSLLVFEWLHANI